MQGLPSDKMPAVLIWRGRYFVQRHKKDRLLLGQAVWASSEGRFSIYWILTTISFSGTQLL